MEPAPTPRDDRTRRTRANLLSLVLLGFLVLVIVVMGLYARRLNTETSASSEARIDNLTWFVAQAEVEFLTLHNAVLSLPSDPDAAALDASGVEQATQAFDIFFSRIRFFDANVFQLDEVESSEMIEQLLLLQVRTLDLAEVIDSNTDNPANLRKMTLPLLVELRPLLRRFALDSLHLFNERTAARRIENTQTLSRFSTMAVILLALLSAIVVIVADLYRDLRTHTRAIDRITASLRSIISAAPQAIVVTDANGIIRDFNHAAEDIFSLSAQQAIGQDIISTILPGGVEALPTLGSSAVMTAHRPGDGDLPVEVTALRDQDSQGRPIHVIFLRDLRQQMAVETTLRRARDIAEQTAQARARFLAVMSHEMRTPLQSVLAALDLMGRGSLSTAQRRHHAIALDSGQNALNQVDDLLDLARREDGAGSEPPTTFDPLLVARRIADRVGVLATEQGNRIVLDLAHTASVGLVTGAGRSFERALGNLVSNAVKFTRGGQITVSIHPTSLPESPEILLYVSVADQGIGIAAKDQARIFEDFETLDNSLTRPQGGTGLGLGIARRAVAALGGSLSLDSAPGQGSRFSFSAQLRRAAPAVAPEVLADGTAPAPALAILLAEDTAVNRILLREMMTRMGHQVTDATNGTEAVALAETRAFDVVVMDISMPILDGIAASAAIRQGGGPSSDAPIMVLTAHTLENDLARIRKSAINQVLTKPIRYDALESALIALTRAPQDPLLDHASFADTASFLPRETHLTLIARFEEEARRDIAALPAAAPDTRIDLLHRLQGSAGLLGTRRLYRLLSEPGTDSSTLRRCLDKSCIALRAEVALAAAQVGQ
ncbi:MAG: ATP-binding protein [Gemmobacter sp.]|nr:ATP-binding protein [Gemmobacter sp.]